jgi:uncharacterized protein YggU (UPF0235/DUF167 family)
MKYIKVIVSTNMKKDAITLKSSDHFLVNVKEKPENNMANKKVIELLSIYFKISKNKIRIINGHHHPHKLIIVEDKQ